MPPRNRQPERQAAKQNVVLDPELLAKRRKRLLDDLERTNATESYSGNNAAANKNGGLSTAKDRAAARTTISISTKKSTMPVRTALLYKKNLNTVIDESGIADLPPNIPTYLTAVSPPPKEPPRMICSACGYWGHYKCLKCAMPYCDRNCKQVHDDTWCERRVI